MVARKPKPQPVIVDAHIDSEAINEAAKSLNELSLMNAESQENAQAIADQLGYEGALVIDVLESEIRFYQRRSVEAVLELGKRLLILKELTAHGEFTERITGLGINQNLARKFMAATLKFSKTVKSTVLEAAGNQSKLLELLAFDDAEIDALESGESARGLTLDRIETMSVSELRKSLRESEANLEASRKAVALRDSKIREVEEERDKKRIQKAPPDEEAAQIRKETSQVATDIEVEIRSNLYRAFEALCKHETETDIPHTNFMLGLVCQIELAVNQLRGQFNLEGEPDGEEVPAWLRGETPEEA